jgi:hypothetical protein
MIRSLIQEIRLVPENGRVQVELRRELAGILACRQTASSLAALRLPGGRKSR